MKSSRRRFLHSGSMLMGAGIISGLWPFSPVMAVNWNRLQANGEGKRVLITGSSSGIGLVAAKMLIAQGHRVVVHGRTLAGIERVKDELAGAEAFLAADFSSANQVSLMADKVNDIGHFDAIIQNAGTYTSATRHPVENDLPYIFMVNTLAPYMLTALIERPERMVFISSSYHRGAPIDINDIRWQQRRWSGYGAYAASKFYDALLANALARHWPQFYANSVRPGWVPTGIGGPNAPDDLEAGAFTQSWLAVSDEPAAKVKGEFFFHMKAINADNRLNDTALQDRFLQRCAELSGMTLTDI